METRTAEEIKIRIGCAYLDKSDPDAIKSMEARGRDIITGLPKIITITSIDAMQALEEPIKIIIDGIRNTLEKAPPEIAADIVTNGLILSGGGGLIKGLDLLIEECTGLKVAIAENALEAVAEGTGKSLSNIEKIQKYAGKRQKEINMNWLREHRRLTVMISLFLILTVMIVVSYNHQGNSTFIGRGIEKVAAFVQGPVSGAGSGVKSGLRGIFQFKSVVKENEDLKKEVASLNREMIQIKLSQAELNELRDLSKILGYENVTRDYDFITADVIAMDGSNWFNLFTINRGTDDGVYPDAVIINGDGLIGRVYDVGPGWAKVISVIDESNSVSFKVFRNVQLLGILSGDGKGGLTGYMIDPNAAVMEGDSLITSGIGMYPEGIAIGKVKKVEWNNDTLLKTVSIEPSAYFKNLQKVTVLIPK